MLFWHGRRSNSPALIAESRHLLTDVATTAGVVVGLILAAATGWTVLDPLLALMVAGLILWSGWDLLRSSVGGLMDVAAPAETMVQIRSLIGANAEGAIEAHDIRTRRAGQLLFVDFHLVVPGAMPVEGAHAICDRIEAALRAEFSGVRATIHVEPDSKAKHSGIVVV
jgi:cation diffusion facilitator family transporter